MTDAALEHWNIKGLQCRIRYYQNVPVMSDWVTAPNVLAIIAVGGVIYAGIRWIVLTTQDRSDFKAFMERIDKDLNAIRSNLSRILGKLGELGEPLVERGSPMRLTGFGQSIAAELRASEWAGGVSGKIAEKAVADALQPYQIDQECEKYVSHHLGAEMTAIVGRVGFERGIKADELLSVLHIVLRDAVLERAKDYQS